MNYYQHHIGDYRRDTLHLSLLEHGIYRQLLDLYYLQEKPIKDDITAIRLLRASSLKEKNAVKQVLNEFFALGENGYFHSRCDKEILVFKNRSHTASLSAKAKWLKNKGSDDANALPTHSERNANHKPITNNQEPTTPLPPKVGARGFEKFWEAYPKRVSKGQAKRTWEKLKPTEQLLGQILAALERAKTSEQWAKESGRFIPHPSTWLNAEGWNDEHETDVKAKDPFAFLDDLPKQGVSRA